MDAPVSPVIQEPYIKILKGDPTIRTSKQLEILMNQLSSIIFFQQLEKENDRETVLKCLRQLKYKEFVKDEVIFKRGDRGDEFYVILKGKVSIYIPQTGSQSTPPPKAKHKSQTHFFLNDMVRINQLSDGQSFGELALIRETPRMATVVCNTDCQMATLSKLDYKMVISVRAQEIVEQKKIELARTFPEMNPRGIQQMVYFIKVRNYMMRNYVVKQFDPFANDPCFFLVKSGEFEIIRMSDLFPKKGLLKQKTQSKSRQICTVTEGQLFGEMDIFLKSERLYSVQCVSERGTVYAIDFDEFTKMLAHTENHKILEIIRGQAKLKYSWMNENTSHVFSNNKTLKTLLNLPASDTEQKSIPNPYLTRRRNQTQSYVNTEPASTSKDSKKETIKRNSVQTDPQEETYLSSIQNKQSVIQQLIRQQYIESKREKSEPTRDIVYVKNGRKDAQQMYWPVEAVLFMNNGSKHNQASPLIPRLTSQSLPRNSQPKQDLEFQLQKIFAFKMKKQVTKVHYKSYSFMN